MCPTATPAAEPVTVTFDAAAFAVFRRPEAVSRTRPCAVCGAAVLGELPAFGPGPRPAPVCGPVCAHRLAVLPARHRCAVCGRQLAWVDWAVGACPDPACRREHLHTRPAREREAVRAADLAAGIAEAARRQSAALAEQPWIAAEAVTTAVVPGLDRREFPLSVAPTDPPRSPGRLPRSRRRALAKHLRATAAAALRDADAPAGDQAARPRPEPPVGGEAELLGAACGACGGRCCRHGSEHAYLGPDTLRRYFAAHPGHGVRRAVAAYTAYVPTTTVPGSCVYHGEAGCGLPRDMRSDICNGYFCEGLVELRSALRDRAAARMRTDAAYIAVVEAGKVTRGTLAHVSEATALEG